MRSKGKWSRATLSRQLLHVRGLLEVSPRRRPKRFGGMGSIRRDSNTLRLTPIPGSHPTRRTPGPAERYWSHVPEDLPDGEIDVPDGKIDEAVLDGIDLSSSRPDSCCSPGTKSQSSGAVILVTLRVNVTFPAQGLDRGRESGNSSPGRDKFESKRD